MAGLTGKTIATTYDSLLKTLADGGITTSLQVIEDGAGDDTCLQLSTKQFLVKSATDIAATFEVQNSSGDTLLTIDTDSSDEEVIINNGGTSTIDFRVESTTEDEALFMDASADILYINKGESAFTTSIHSTNDVAMTIGSSGVVFNEDGHATNDFRVESDSNTHMLFVDSGNNKVGIGTGSPDKDLHVYNGSGSAYVVIDCNDNDDSSIVRFTVDGTDNNRGYIEYDFDSGSIANDAMEFGVNSNSVGARMILTGSGLLGIGTITPNVEAGQGVDIENTTTNATDEGGSLRLGANDGTVMVNTERLGVIEFAGAEDGSSTMALGAKIEAVAAETWDASNNGASLDFYTTPGDNNPTQRMTILTDGKVGIGTATPAEIFSIKGDAGRIIMEDGSGNPAIYMGDDSGGFLNLYNAAGDTILIHLDADSDSHITNTLGIGTTTPISPLEVEAGLTTTGAVFTLGTKEPSVVAYDVLGRINFYAPLDTGADSDLIGASIAAVAQDTFSDTVNSTALYFHTGKSEDAAAATAKMVIDEDGLVGIGVTAPTTALHIVDSAVGYVAQFINSEGTEPYGIGIEYSGGSPNDGTSRFITCLDNASSGTIRMWVLSNGDVQTVTGTNIAAISDERLKTNIADYTGGLAIVNALKPKTFTWKAGVERGMEGTRYGFMAQEIVEVEGYKENMNLAHKGKYDEAHGEAIKNLCPDGNLYTSQMSAKECILISAIQELSAKVTALENA